MIVKFPTISVIIPTFNRPKPLASCLGALVNQDYAADEFEVIVVDDGGSCKLQPVLEPFRKKIDLRLVSQKNQGPASARNNGAMKAAGKFLAFTDDDCAPDRDWLKKLCVRFDKNPEKAVGGDTVNRLKHNIYSTSSQLLIDYLFEHFNAVSDSARFFTSSNLAFPKDRFFSIGGFNSMFRRGGGEDRDLCSRWLHRGYRMTHAPECRVFHSHEMKLTGFLRQHFNYGRGAFHFHKNSYSRNLGKLNIEPLPFYSRMILYPFYRFSTRRRHRLVLLLIIAQIANIGGFFWEMSHEIPGTRNHG